MLNYASHFARLKVYKTQLETCTPCPPCYTYMRCYSIDVVVVDPRYLGT